MLAMQDLMPIPSAPDRFYRYRETLGTIVKRIKGGGDASQRVKVPLPTGVDLIPTGEAERIFLSDNEGDALTINEPLECVVRIVKVAYVMPGGSPPPAAIADYWFDQVRKGYMGVNWGSLPHPFGTSSRYSARIDLDACASLFASKETSAFSH
jgi:hypothetical protein